MATSTDLKAWAEERDRKLVDWFAEGRSDEEMSVLASQHGYDLSAEGVTEKREQLRSRILEAEAAGGLKLLARIGTTSRNVRVRKLDEMIARAERGMKWCEDNDKWSVFPKVADAAMKALRLIDQEIHGVALDGGSREADVQLVAALSPEDRVQFALLWGAMNDLLHKPRARVIEAEVLSLPMPEEVKDADA